MTQEALLLQGLQTQHLSDSAAVLSAAAALSQMDINTKLSGSCAAGLEWKVLMARQPLQIRLFSNGEPYREPF